MNAKHEVFKHHNSIIELSRMISEMAWKGLHPDEPVEMDPSVIAALADGINAAANAALETTQGCLINMRDKEHDNESKGDNHDQ
jgi:hypothetical protein